MKSVEASPSKKKTVHLINKKENFCYLVVGICKDCKNVVSLKYHCNGMLFSECWERRVGELTGKFAVEVLSLASFWQSQCNRLNSRYNVSTVSVGPLSPHDSGEECNHTRSECHSDGQHSVSNLSGYRTEFIICYHRITNVYNYHNSLDTVDMWWHP